MTNTRTTLTQRLFAAMLSVLLLLAQLAMPAAALAEVDVTYLPLLDVAYTDLNGELFTLTVNPVATGINMDEVVYWAQLPGDVSWETPVTLKAVSQDGSMCLPDGSSPYPAVNAADKDDISFTGWVEIYNEDFSELLASYPIYLSTLPLPEEEPVFANVVINYVDVATGEVKLSDTKTDLTPGEYWFQPERAGEVAGYELVSSDAQLVTVYDDGTTSGDITFQMQVIPPKTANVVINYVDVATGEVKLSDTKTDLTPGEYWFQPERAGEVAGYELISSDAQLVTVYDDGTTSGDITFQMQVIPPKTANVVINYVDVATGEVKLSDTKTDLTPGEYWFQPERAGEVAGYELVSSDAQLVTVYDDGTTSGDITFQMQVIPPKTANVVINYVDVATGEVKLSDTKTDLTPGEYWFQPERAGEVAGYELVSSDAQLVTVYDDGTTSGDITFQMQVIPAPVFGSIVINYVNAETGEVLLSETKQDLTPGEYWFTPDRAGEVAGYELLSTDPQMAVIAADGTASNQINFAMQKIVEPEPEPVYGSIVINYVNAETGEVLLSETKSDLTPGEYWFTPDRAGEVAGYELLSTDPQMATIAADGTASNQINFAMQKIVEPEPEPVYGNIVINYVNAETGEVLLSETKQDLTPGEYWFTPDRAGEVAGYELLSTDPQMATIAADGTASNQINFAMQKIVEPEPEPVYGNIVINYVNAETGEVLLSETKSDLTPGEYWFTPDRAGEVAGYELLSTDPQMAVIAADGTASNQINFAMQKIVEPEPEPVYGNIIINYVNAETGEVLLSETKQDLTPGEYWFTPDRAGEVTGYTIVNDEPQYAVVYADGTASNQLYFQMQKIAAPEPEPGPEIDPLYGSVTIHYVDADTNTFLLSDLITDLAPGTYNITPDKAGEIAGYQLVSSEAQTVIISEDGTASGEVIFRMQKIAAPEPEPDPELTQVIGRNGTTNAKGLNMRKNPWKESNNAIGSISKTGTQVYVYGLVINSDGEEWYKISYNGTDGYVMAKYVDLVANSGEVYVSYATAAGEFASQTVTVSDDNSVVSPDASKVPEGYTAISAEPVTITFDSNGAPVPAQIVFMYSEPEKTGSVQVRYLCGETVLFEETVTVSESSNVVNADLSKVPEGYTAINAEAVTVTFGSDGSVSPAAVDFTFQAPEKSGQVTVRYLCGETVLFEETVTVTESSNVVSPDMSKVPSGYTAINVEPVTITFTKKGKPDPATVDFTFQAPEKSGQVTVRYLCGETVLFEDTVTVTESSNVVSADLSKVPEGYTAINTEPVTISFTKKGKPNPSAVDFTFQAPEKKGSVTVRYISGETVLFEETVAVSESSNVISADLSKVPEGYTAINTDPVTVTFGADGTPSPSVVSFLFNAPAPAEKSGKVTVVYMAGRTELASEVVVVSESQNVVSPNLALVPQQYTAINVEPVTITFDENGHPSPARVEFTFQAPEKTGQVLVSYVTQRGEFYKQTVAVSESNNVIAPDTANVPTGYTPVSVEPVTISFDASGAPIPAAVTFVYQAPALSGSVMVQYVNAATGAAFNGEVIAVTEGQNTIRPNAAMIPSGYTAVNAAPVQVTLGADGVVTPDTVTFTYQAPPITGTVDVLYVTAQQGTFASETVPLSEGENTIKPNKNLIPDGYTAVQAEPVTVTLNADGTTQPSSVAFVYQPPAAPVQKASVTFRFADEDGKELLAAQVVELEDGTHDAAEYAAKLDGYTCKGPSANLIRVSGGVAEPAEITFTYVKNKTTATLEIHYLDAIGRELGNSPEVLELAKGEHTIQPNAAFIPKGYSLGSGSAQSHKVVVGDDLVARPNSVSFTLIPNSVMGRVTVRYVDVSDMSVIASEVLTLRPGTHTITRDDTKAGENYEPAAAGAESVKVTVNDLGQPDQAVVVFHYQKKQSEVYMGYALVTTQTHLRKAYNNDESSVIAILPVNTLVYVNGQTTVDGTDWSSCQIMLGNSGASGVVLTSALKPIDKEQAEAIIEQFNQQQPPIAQQISGYYITLSDNVPMRAQADAQSAAMLWLAKDRVVYVSGMEYRNNTSWYLSDFEGISGFIRHDQLRKMTAAEVEAYLNQQPAEPTPTPGATPAPYDPYGNSSYGYVNSSSVNFREEPNGTRIKTLNRYAFCLVLGTREVNGVTWYNVNQNGTVGWIHGDYFHQLNLTELTAFLNSDEYKQGLNANSGNTNTGNIGTSNETFNGGVAQPGNIGSVEDWNVGTWQNTGVSVQTSYAPFNPIATATPLPSESPMPSDMVTPTPTFAIGTMIPIDYTDESKETQSATAPWGLIAAGVVLIGGAGGVYAYAMNQNRKRKAAAARAAQARRAQANQGPNARRPGPAPAAGNARPQGQAGQRPYTVQQAPNPYAQTGSNPYAGGSSESRNPYSNGTITGNAEPRNGYQSGFAPMSSAQTDASPYVAPDFSQNRPQSSGAQESAPAMGTNPFARPIDQSVENPYARPMEEQPQAQAAPRRRSGRMERYHDAGNGTDAEA